MVFTKGENKGEYKPKFPRKTIEGTLIGIQTNPDQKVMVESNGKTTVGYKRIELVFAVQKDSKDEFTNISAYLEGKPITDYPELAKADRILEDKDKDMKPVCKVEYYTKVTVKLDTNGNAVIDETTKQPIIYRNNRAGKNDLVNFKVLREVPTKHKPKAETPEVKAMFDKAEKVSEVVK